MIGARLLGAGSDQRQRELRLSLAILTSLASKGVGFFAQVLTLPLVVAGLGETRYAAYLALTALVAWTAPLGFGLLPALTQQLADVAAKGNVSVEARLVGAAFWVTLALGTMLGLFTLIVGKTADIGALTGVAHSVSPHEMTIGFVAAMGVMSVHFFATLSTAVRAGYQENFVSNGLSLVANLFIIGGIFLIDRRHTPIATFILIIYAPYTAMYLMDVVWLFAGRPKLWPPRVPRWSTIVHGDLRALFSASGVTWAAQIHYFLTVFGTVLLVSHRFGSAETAAYGSLMRLTVLCNSVIGLVIWPSVPALSDATARGDVAWVRKATIRLVGLSLAAAAVVAVALIAAGPELMRLWLGRGVAPSPLLCAGFGVYFVASTLNFTLFNVLLAIGATRGVGRAYVIEAALVYALAALLMAVGGVAGVGWALAAAALAVNGWLLPLKTIRRIRQIGAVRAA